MGDVCIEGHTRDDSEPLLDSVDRRTGVKKAPSVPSLNMTSSWVIFCIPTSFQWSGQHFGNHWLVQWFLHLAAG